MGQGSSGAVCQASLAFGHEGRLNSSREREAGMKNRKCERCHKRNMWDTITRLCEPCYDKLSESCAQIKTPKMGNKTWRRIVTGK